MKAAAEYTCSCGHALGDHESPGGNANPWGACRVDIAPANPGPMTRCDCGEAWPIEDDEEEDTQ